MHTSTLQMFVLFSYLLLNTLESNRRLVGIEFTEILPIDISGQLKILIQEFFCCRTSDSRESSSLLERKAGPLIRSLI
jgi:hypothetical protein